MIDLTNHQVLRDLLFRYDFHFSKKLGQNFLINPTVCPRIAREGIPDEQYNVLEIGPGIGTLTQQLAQRAHHVTAIEIDKRLIPILTETVGEFSNLHICQGDILKINISEFFQKEFGDSPVAVCANLPYYITTPILMRLLESDANITCITVMVQREVAQKITATIGTRAAGAITVAVQYYGTAKILFPVNRNSFYPAPNVDSAVIQIQPQKQYRTIINNKDLFFKIVHGGFNQRRKTLINALAGTCGFSKTIVYNALNNLNISPQARIENLTMEQLIALSNTLNIQNEKE